MPSRLIELIPPLAWRRQPSLTRPVALPFAVGPSVLPSRSKVPPPAPLICHRAQDMPDDSCKLCLARKGVLSGKSVSVPVALGSRRLIKKKTDVGRNQLH